MRFIEKDGLTFGPAPSATDGPFDGGRIQIVGDQQGDEGEGKRGLHW